MDQRLMDYVSVDVEDSPPPTPARRRAFEGLFYWLGSRGISVMLLIFVFTLMPTSYVHTAFVFLVFALC